MYSFSLRGSWRRMSKIINILFYSRPDDSIRTIDSLLALLYMVIILFTPETNWRGLLALGGSIGVALASIRWIKTPRGYS